MASTSSFSLGLANNGSGRWTPTVLRNPTAPSGGTSLTIPWVTNNNSGSSTTTRTPGIALQACYRAVVDDDVSTSPGTSTNSYSIYLANDGQGVFTPSARLNPTQASGGTTVTIPWVTNNNSGSSTSSSRIQDAFQAGMRAILNNIADGY